MRLVAQRSEKPAIYEDIENLAPHVTGQILDGVLYTNPRPGIPHARALSSLGGALDGPFDKGRGGPGGWILLFEPELRLGTDVIVPDYAGWRRETLPELPTTAAISTAPDWVCEGLSPSTSAVDRGPKLRKYARELVRHVWFVDADAKTLEVLRLDGETYRIVATHSQDERACAEPFDAIEIDLASLWAR